VYYSFANEPVETRSFERFLPDLEPNGMDLGGFRFSYDAMRTEQHYASQTAGLDISFDVETALFFATHRFRQDEGELAYYEQVDAPHHAGVICCFRFLMPFVEKSRHLIQDTDFFKTFRAERVLRQACGLPLFDPYERNVAVTDIDCIIELEPDFEDASELTPEFLFPSAAEDPFYAKLLELKDDFPTELANVVEYRWARG
jgi:hypothetical protein